MQPRLKLQLPVNQAGNAMEISNFQPQPQPCSLALPFEHVVLREILQKLEGVDNSHVQNVSLVLVGLINSALETKLIKTTLHRARVVCKVGLTLR